MQREMGMASGAEQRFGTRVEVEVRASLVIAGQRVPGTIRNIGPRGVYFAAPNLAPSMLRAGSATLAREGGADVPVRVAWQRGADGVGLEFVVR